MAFAEDVARAGGCAVWRAMDTGAIRVGALDIDVPATIRKAAEFHADPAADARIDE